MLSPGALRAASGAALLLALGGCGDTERGKEMVARDFRDPASLQWRDVRMVEHGGSDYLCGEVNGKNGFGAYAGFRPFVVDIGWGKAALEPRPQPGDDAAMTEAEAGFYRLLSSPCRQEEE
ncbi:hypothetical protein ACFOMD_01680 [Sphingoaurantiacus capsulatus]|uniref:Lipoprotein n=1 Tax=Sphingoaurantiacus capsulatus TaxID=1771310 RepID=A0ABV7X5P4_9SPHN